MERSRATTSHQLLCFLLSPLVARQQVMKIVEVMQVVEPQLGQVRCVPLNPVLERMRMVQEGEASFECGVESGECGVRVRSAES